MLKTRTIEEVVDDLDGETLAKTIKFGLNEFDYEIDLSDEHRLDLYRALDPFIKAARQLNPAPSKADRAAALRDKPKAVKSTAKPRKRTTRKPAKRSNTPSDHIVRSWALENGVEVNKAGRVPTKVREQFVAAHQDQQQNAA